MSVAFITGTSGERPREPRGWDFGEPQIFRSARIKPAVVQIESHPYLPQTDFLEFCYRNAVAPLGHGIKPGVMEDPTIVAIARRVHKTPAQVLLAWAVQCGTAVLTTPKTPGRARENFDNLR